MMNLGKEWEKEDTSGERKGKGWSKRKFIQQSFWSLQSPMHRQGEGGRGRKKRKKGEKGKGGDMGQDLLFAVEAEGKECKGGEGEKGYWHSVSGQGQGVGGGGGKIMINKRRREKKRGIKGGEKKGGRPVGE